MCSASGTARSTCEASPRSDRGCCSKRCCLEGGARTRPEVAAACPNGRPWRCPVNRGGSGLGNVLQRRAAVGEQCEMRTDATPRLRWARRGPRNHAPDMQRSLVMLAYGRRAAPVCYATEALFARPSHPCSCDAAHRTSNTAGLTSSASIGFLRNITAVGVRSAALARL